jgi:hypothetical protein
MKLAVLNLHFDPEMGGFDDGPLQELSKDKEIPILSAMAITAARHEGISTNDMIVLVLGIDGCLASLNNPTLGV